MNTPISFELAKLLKEKGYDQTLTDIGYNVNGQKSLDYTIDRINGTGIAAPIIAEVVMWLYEKHGIWIDVVLSRNERRFTFMIQSFSFDANKFLNEYFNSPTEAYEAAIEYVLNNLI